MKYGIIEDNKFVIIDDNIERLKNTLPFMPKLESYDISEYEDSEIEKGIDGAWYLKGFAPKKSLEELKEEKLKYLKDAFQNTRKTAHCMCFLGFEIDANEEANTNITGLITVMKDDETTLFRSYDNSFHEVSKSDLVTMRNNIIANSQFLYQMKWQMEIKIQEATTEEELNNLVWTY